MIIDETMMKKVSKRLNFDEQLPKLCEGNQAVSDLYLGFRQMDRKRRREDAGGEEYRKRRQSVCSESDSSVDGFDTDENTEDDIEEITQIFRPAKQIFQDTSLPLKPVVLIPALKNQTQTNINPFSPTGSKINRVKSETDPSFISDTPDKCMRLTLCNISSIKRYESEFLELEQLASGCFGQVMLARHRLDGVEYAIKISKKHLRVGSHEEKKALNEVFAHATLNSHKHVVRYYNSWVEKGQVYIQNEFCQGGSLNEKIEEKRISGQNFSEEELKKILRHTLKGLQYIHSNNLVHLDIKPENIFISVEHDDEQNCGVEGFDYKIGDLGHIQPICGGDTSPEEGDCRYMAPEFLQSKLDSNLISKADIFSLGLTLYEAASLKCLPKNSSEHPSYLQMKKGNLPYLGNYSKQFNHLFMTMVHPDPCLRPSATKLLSDPLLTSSMALTKTQICMELNQTKEKLERLIMQLGDVNENNLRREQ